MRTTHYGDFAKLGLDKEAARAEDEGAEASGDAVLNRMDREMKELKDRLKNAGVEKMVAGIDASQEDEYEYYDEEDEEEEEETEGGAEKAVEKTPEVLH